MAHVEQHTMELDKVYESGAEEWTCPVCGRRFIVQWPPAYKKIILEPGDEYAFHNGGKGSVFTGAPEVRDTQVAEPPLAPIWLEAIATLDFGD